MCVGAQALKCAWRADYSLLKRRINEAAAMRKRQNAKAEVVTAMTTVFQGLFDHELEKVCSAN